MLVRHLREERRNLPADPRCAQGALLLQDVPRTGFTGLLSSGSMRRWRSGMAAVVLLRGYMGVDIRRRSQSKQWRRGDQEQGSRREGDWTR